MLRHEKFKFPIFLLVVVLCFTSIGIGPTFAINANAAIGDTYYSRAYTTDGAGTVLPDQAHHVTYEICPPISVANPIVINDDFVEQHGTVYRLSGTLSRTSGSGENPATTGLVRVETTHEIVLIADGATFSTTAGSGNLRDGPLVVGKASNDSITSIISANVTLILVDDTTNNFTTLGASTNKGGRQAGISVETGSTLTIRSGYKQGQVTGGVKGILNAQGGRYGAGIGAGPNREAGSIIITGGKIIAKSFKGTGGDGNGAGIGGGGGNQWGGGSVDKIEIYGDAHVEATSMEHGAGLGGGGGGAAGSGQVGTGPGDGGPTYIYGDAYVEAIASGKGAGIGGGARSASSGTLAAGKATLTNIYGNATVVSSSGEDGAGIGGGGVEVANILAGEGGTINIYENASVSAISSSNGAGIGGGGAQGSGGTGGAGGTITIFDSAKVEAISEGNGAGVGGGGSSTGMGGAGGNILLTGDAKISGVSEGNGAGIGGGGSQSGTGGAGGTIEIKKESDTKAPTVVAESGASFAKGPGLGGDAGTITITSGNVHAVVDSATATNGTPNDQTVNMIKVSAPGKAPGYIIDYEVNKGTSGSYHYIAIANNAGDAYLWIPDARTVTYNSGGADEGTAPIDSNSPYLNDAADIDPVTVLGKGDLSKEGFYFGGWDDGEGNIYHEGDSIDIMKDITLTARWLVDELHVYYDANNPDEGTAPVDPKLHGPGDDVVVLDKGDLAKTGYTFGGWGDDPTSPSAIYQPGGILNMPSTNVTLTAIWTATDYTVTYYPGDGAVTGNVPIASNPYHFGDNIIVLGNVGSPILERPNCDFDGWEDQDGNKYLNTGSPTSSFIMPNKNVSLTAIWDPVYSVTYEGGTASSGVPPVETKKHASGETVLILDEGTLVKENHTFAGWLDSIDKYIYQPSESFTMTGAAVMFTAQWDCKIEFNADGGTPAPSDQRIDDGDKIQEPATMTKAHHTFGGWYTDDKFTSPWDFANGTVSGNMTLYAKWEAEENAVDFNSNGGTITPPTQMIPYDQNVMEPNPKPTRTGYTLEGWYSDVGLNTKWNFATDTVTAPMTLYAKWEKNKYTVTYLAGGGSGSVPIDPLSPHEYDESVSVLGNTGPLTRLHSVFTGWIDQDGNKYPEATISGAAFMMPAKNVILTAMWGPAYTLTYDANGGIGIPPVDSNVYTASEAAIVQDEGDNLSNPGHDFIGWTDNSSGSGTLYNRYDDYIMPTHDVTLYAQWDAALASTASITFNSNGGSAVSQETVTIGELMPEPSPPPTKAGFTFGGWYSDAGLTAKWNFASDTVTGDMTLYAKWIRNSGGSPQGGSDSPDTGDSTNITIFVTAMIISGLMLISLLVFDFSRIRFRRKQVRQ